ncbi:hypothetical protein QFC22_005112 [Naganishia vaughanmartiniae]|uniref:Uncharacterized protein n=1 Tax=Naganishia vaughanmartiniae TaxID=1424756 RepID=A0ACC2WXT1_9TREE|nr:hypothetical protein QFC22_005112 [Naganishia vaughanmartiniae]
MSQDEDDEDIDLPSIQSLAKARLPIVIPWSKLCSNVGPGTFFHSSLAASGATDPWSKISPFQQSSGDDEASNEQPFSMVYSSSSGTTGTFRSSATSSAMENNEHLTVGLKVSVDAFIVSASVKGQYDKHVKENNDVSLSSLEFIYRIVYFVRGVMNTHSSSLRPQQIKKSVRSSYRLGSIRMDRLPSFNNEALIALKYEGGLSAFEEKYGDYYVCGCALGADNAMLASASMQSNKQSEVLNITAKVESIFGDASWSKDTRSSSASFSMGLSISGYDTLDQEIHNVSVTSQSMELQRVAKDLMSKGQDLPGRVQEKAAQFGLMDEAGEETFTLTRETYKRMVDGGLVLEFLLMPVASLREVHLWTMNDNII